MCPQEGPRRQQRFALPGPRPQALSKTLHPSEASGHAKGSESASAVPRPQPSLPSTSGGNEGGGLH